MVWTPPWRPMRCDDSHPTIKDSVATVIHAVTPETLVGDNELQRWQKNFDSHAKADDTGSKFLDQEAFLEAIAPKQDYSKIKKEQYATLFKVANTSKTGKVSWDEFVVFESLLKRPDAQYMVAFKWFDTDGNGEVSLEEFKSVFAAAIDRPESIPFDFAAPWVKLYLGKKKGQHILGYNEFSQLMKGLQGERLRQAFRYFDKDESGYIKPDEFGRIINELARHKLSDYVLDRLPTLCTLSPGGRISYSEVIAFHNVIRGMDLAETIIRDACAKSKDGRISRADFLDVAANSTRYSNFTPLEASIIFHFAGAGNKAGRLSLRDFAQLLDPKWERPPEPEALTKQSTFLKDLAKSAYNFGLGGIAGAIGATAVYPIDLVKTRMQNQRSRIIGELLYKNGIDCAKKVYANEGLRGFYRGLPPQLIGVAPEKAIKLTVNDLVRGKLKDPDTGKIGVLSEMLAGGCAGASQVVFTNPLEIVKIRLQMQGENVKSSGDALKRGAGHIIRQLGLVGLYKGAAACLLRDVPFSAIYFTAYARLKKEVFHEGFQGKKLGFFETLTAAGVAGMPAAYLTTPADVIKTRLQSEARKGESTYRGIADAFQKIMREEGTQALFKGGLARVLRSSPQFGVTLVAYETLQTVLPYSRIDPTQAPTQTLLNTSPEDMTRIRARSALKILLDCHPALAVMPTQTQTHAKTR